MTPSVKNAFFWKEKCKFVINTLKKMENVLERITFNSQVMGGKACIRGMRVTVTTVVGLVASGLSFDEILDAYPYLQLEDIKAALTYAAWRVGEIEVPIKTTA